MNAPNNKFFDSLTSLSSNLFVTIEGVWEKKRLWDWNGTITANEPIVAISFLRVGNRVEWARSKKDLTTKLDVRLFLGIFDSDPRDVSVGFSIGLNGPRWRTLLDDSNQPPEISQRNIAVGKPFVFCKPFGNPAIELFGLIILRDHVTGARNGVWHIKRIYRESLPKEWLHILAFGRAGWFKIED
jgi:hypothetical protein